MFISVNLFVQVMFVKVNPFIQVMFAEANTFAEEMFLQENPLAQEIFVQVNVFVKVMSVRLNLFVEIMYKVNLFFYACQNKPAYPCNVAQVNLFVPGMFIQADLLIIVISLQVNKIVTTYLSTKSRYCYPNFIFHFVSSPSSFLNFKISIVTLNIFDNLLLLKVIFNLFYLLKKMSVFLFLT